MNEDELRESLRTTLTLSPPPPPMDSAGAVAAGRRATRRRTALAGIGATAVAAAVVAVAVVPGQLFAAPGGDSSWGAAAQPSAAPTAQPSGPGSVTQEASPGSVPEATPGPDDTKPTWPIDGNGQPQEDATAKSGQNYERGEKVLEGLLAVAPAGYGTPTGETPGDPDARVPLQRHQGAVEQDSSWGYLASIALTKGDGMGQLVGEVHMADNTLPTEPCALAAAFWGLGGDCEVRTVDGKQVGVATAGPSDEPLLNRLDQWAAYRYPDGTAVFVAQSKQPPGIDHGLKPLTALPFTADQLAKLAVDQRFDIG